MKTIEEWIDTIPEPARTYARNHAIQYSEYNYKMELTEDLYDAIEDAFIWRDTPQGEVYWNRVARGEI